MFQRARSPTVFFGGFVLTVIAGWTNSVGFLSVIQQGITHVTGTLTVTALELAAGHGLSSLRLLVVVLCFFVGSTISGIMVGDPSLAGSGRAAWALLLEAALFFGAMLLFRHVGRAAEYLAAIACGMQNALATSYQGISLRTTHMTGLVTDLGVSFGHAVRRQPVSSLRVLLYCVLLMGFFVGALGGGLSFPVLGPYTLAVPAVLATAMGLTGLWRARHLAADG